MKSWRIRKNTQRFNSIHNQATLWQSKSLAVTTSQSFVARPMDAPYAHNAEHSADTQRNSRSPIYPQHSSKLSNSGSMTVRPHSTPHPTQEIWYATSHTPRNSRYAEGEDSERPTYPESTASFVCSRNSIGRDWNKNNSYHLRINKYESRKIRTILGSSKRMITRWKRQSCLTLIFMNTCNGILVRLSLVLSRMRSSYRKSNSLEETHK